MSTTTSVTLSNTAWTDLETLLSLLPNVAYTIQCIGSSNILIKEALTIPDIDDKGFILSNMDSGTITIESNGFWAKSVGSRGLLLVNV